MNVSAPVETCLGAMDADKDGRISLREFKAIGPASLIFSYYKCGVQELPSRNGRTGKLPLSTPEDFEFIFTLIADGGEDKSGATITVNDFITYWNWEARPTGSSIWSQSVWTCYVEIFLYYGVNHVLHRDQTF